MVSMPRVSINTDMSEGLCFCCGHNNPIGLKLDFQYDGREVRTEFVPHKYHQGWPGIVHGGIIICMLDEAMGYAGHFEGVTCLTAKMEIQLRRLALVDEPLIITSTITKNTRKLIETKAKVSLRDGTVVAEGKSKHFVVERKSGDAGSEEESRSNA